MPAKRESKRRAIVTRHQQTAGGALQSRRGELRSPADNNPQSASLTMGHPLRSKGPGGRVDAVCPARSRRSLRPKSFTGIGENHPPEAGQDTQTALLVPEQTLLELEKSVSRIEKLADYLQKIKLGEYLQLLQRPKRVIKLNLLGGMAKGFGVAIGATLLVALAIYLLIQISNLDLPPLLGGLIDKILDYLENSRGTPI